MAIFFIILAIASIIGIAIRNRIAEITGITVDTVVRVIIWTFFSLVAILSLRSCSASADNGTGVGNGIWIICAVGLVVAATKTRDKPYLAWIFAVIAGIILVILMGKADTFFSWTVIGLPAFAAAGIWGHSKTEGRTKSFLGLAAGFIILVWLYLFIQVMIHPDLTFLGERINGTQKIIIFLAIGLFLFATWKRSFIFYLFAFLVLASWLGKDVFDTMANNYPDQLKLPVSTSKIGESVGKIAEAYTNKLSANADRQILTSRQDSQSQKTWKIAAGTKIFAFTADAGVTVMNLAYAKEVEVISLGSATEINGVSYEKCSLPDPATEQPGKQIGWVRSIDLKPMAMRAKVFSYTFTKGTGFQEITLEKGNYEVEPMASISLDIDWGKNYKVVKNFPSSQNQKGAVWIDHPATITIYKLSD